MRFRKVQARGPLPPYPAYWWTEEGFRDERYERFTPHDEETLERYARYRFRSPADWAYDLKWRADDFEDGTGREYTWYGIEVETENEFGKVMP